MKEYSQASFFDRLLNVPSSDPDDARRRKILNILLLGTGSITLVAILMLVVFSFSGTALGQLSGPIWFAAFGVLGGTFIVYWLNRNQHLSGWIASSLFLFLLSIIFIFSDSPQELAGGRSLFVFIIPIVMASMLLRPYASFFFAFLAALEVILISNYVNIFPNAFAIFGFFLIAIISWLSARSLEQALAELRNINTHLDHLVEQKTQELAGSLSRELILAGRNQAILESIADGVVVFDTDGTATQANPALSSLFEISTEKIVGASVQELTEMESLNAKSRESLVGMLINPNSNQASQRITWGKKTLSVNAALVQNLMGEPLGTVAVFRDFTREAELERMKDSFLATVSHELRTPLNAILGYAEMFKEAIYGPVNEKQVGVSERIMTNSRRLLTLVNDLLDQARMEAGKLSIHIGPFKPSELLDSVHGVMDKIATDKGLNLTSELDPALPPIIHGDVQRLQQILVNLSNNAVKFTDTGAIHMYLSKLDDEHWQLSVSDTGRGMPADELPRIFEAFRQVDATATREHGGFGLGLTIVKQLVGLMNGDITVSSEEGKGSTFTITLPLTVS